MKIAFIYLLLLILGSIIPYSVISLVLWDYDMSNWNVWARLIFCIWVLFIVNTAYNKLRKKLK